MKTTIWTSWDVSKAASFSEGEGKPRCVWRGELPHLFRKEDEIVVLDGYCVERISHVYYSILDDTQEIGLVTCDSGREYPTVPFADLAPPVAENINETKTP